MNNLVPLSKLKTKMTTEKLKNTRSKILERKRKKIPIRTPFNLTKKLNKMDRIKTLPPKTKSQAKINHPKITQSNNHRMKLKSKVMKRKMRNKEAMNRVMMNSKSLKKRMETRIKKVKAMSEANYRLAWCLLVRTIFVSKKEKWGNLASKSDFLFVFESI